MVERDGNFEKLPDGADSPDPVIPVPADDDLSGYLLPPDLMDANVEQRFAAVALPTADEIQPVLMQSQSVVKEKSPDPDRLLQAFDAAIDLLARVERKLFDQPLFDQSPYERLSNIANAASRITTGLETAQKQVAKVCSKNPEMVTFGFYKAVEHYLCRICIQSLEPANDQSAEEDLSIIELDDTNAANTNKRMAELTEDCSLAADRLVISAGFSPVLPTLESPAAKTDEEGNSIPLDEISDGHFFLEAKADRRSYLLRRDANDGPKIDIGALNPGVGREQIQLVADSLKQVAIAELKFAKANQTELAMSLALATKRSTEFNEQRVPFDRLRLAVELLSDQLIATGAWKSLEGRNRRAFSRLRNQKIAWMDRGISAASVAAAKARRERAETIRFKAAELMARNEHPAIKYVDDLIEKETAAYRIATELVDSGKHRDTLDELVQNQFTIEPPGFDSNIVPPPDEDGDDLNLADPNW